MAQSKVIGIDLGTTNSCVAVMQGNDAAVLTPADGGRTTPSMVAFTRTGDRIVGHAAKRLAVTNPQTTVFSIKRFMGRKLADPTIEYARRIVPFELSSGENGDVRVRIGPDLFAPEEISAMLLQKLKQDAELSLGEKVTEAVITVPAYFNDAQRQATKDAGKIAGLNVLRIINEPTAAALAAGLDPRKNQKIAVYDLGGGTFDVSILELGRGIFEVQATNGNTYLGGNDFDHRVVQWIFDRFREGHRVELSQDPVARQRVLEAAEKAKCQLSTLDEVEISLPFVASVNGSALHLQLTLTRETLERITADLVEGTIEPCRRALEDAGTAPEDIAEVVMVGGQTRMPAVVRAVGQYFGRSPYRGANPDEAVALGAAIQAGILRGGRRDVLLLDVTALSLGVRTQGGGVQKIIEKNTTIPVRKKQSFTTVEDFQDTVEIHVVQGDSDKADECKSLGLFHLVGIAPAAAGVPKVEVLFDIDANGIIRVSARDTVTGREQAISITDANGLSGDEIERISLKLRAPVAPHPPAGAGADAAATAAAAPSEMAGALAEMPASDLLQLVYVQGQSGRLEVGCGDTRCLAFFRGGEPFFAQCGRHAGADALIEAMGWSDGTFRFVPGDGALQDAPPDNIAPESGQAILLDGMRRRLEKQVAS